MIKKIADLIFIAGIPTPMAWYIAKEWATGKTAPGGWVEALITIGVILLGVLTFPLWLLSKLVDRWFGTDKFIAEKVPEMKEIDP